MAYVVASGIIFVVVKDVVEIHPIGYVFDHFFSFWPQFCCVSHFPSLDGIGNFLCFAIDLFQPNRIN